VSERQAEDIERDERREVRREKFAEAERRETYISQPPWGRPAGELPPMSYIERRE